MIFERIISCDNLTNLFFFIMSILLSSHGVMHLIAVGAILGVYLLYLLIRAIVNYYQSRKEERDRQMRQYMANKDSEPITVTATSQQFSYSSQPSNHVPPQLRHLFPYGVPSFYRPRAKDVPAGLWVVIVCAFLGALLSIFIAVGIVIEDSKAPAVLGALLLVGLGILIGVSGVGMRRLKKNAGKLAQGLLVLLLVAGVITMMVLLINEGPQGFYMLIPIAIVGLLLWLLTANMKYLY